MVMFEDLKRPLAVVGVFLLVAVLWVNAPKLGFSTSVEDGETEVTYVSTAGVPYILSSDEHWERGEYFLNGDLIIPPEKTLVIEAGVEVRALGGGGHANYWLDPDGPNDIPGDYDDPSPWTTYNVGIYVYGSIIVRGTYDEGMVRFTNQNSLVDDPPYWEELWGGIHILPAQHYPGWMGGFSDRIVHIDHADVTDAYIGISVCGRSMDRDHPTVTISNSRIHGNGAGILVGLAMNAPSIPAFHLMCGVYEVPADVFPEASYQPEPEIPEYYHYGPASPLIELNEITGNMDEVSPWFDLIRDPDPDIDVDTDGDGWLDGIEGISEDVVVQIPFPFPPRICTGIYIFDSSPNIRYNEISDNGDFGVVDIKLDGQLVYDLATNYWGFGYIFIPQPFDWVAGQMSTILFHNNLQDNGFEAWWNLQFYLQEPSGGLYRCSIYNLQPEENFVKGNMVTYFGSDATTGTAGKIETAERPYLAEQVAGGADPRVNPKIEGPAWDDVGIQGLPRMLEYSYTYVEETTIVDTSFVVYDEDDEQIKEIKLFWRDQTDDSVEETGAINVPSLFGNAETSMRRDRYEDRLVAVPYDELSEDNPYIWQVPWTDSPATTSGIHPAYSFDIPTVDGELDTTEDWMNLQTFKQREGGWDSVYAPTSYYTEDNTYLYAYADMSTEFLYLGGVMCNDIDDGTETISLYSDYDMDGVYDEYLTYTVGSGLGGSPYQDITTIEFAVGFTDYGPASTIDLCNHDNDVRSFEAAIPFSGTDLSLIDRTWYDVDEDSFWFQFEYGASLSVMPPFKMVYPSFAVHDWLVDVPTYVDMVMKRYDEGWHVEDMAENVDTPNLWEVSFDTGVIDPDNVEFYAWAHDHYRGANWFCHPEQDHPWYGVFIWERDEGAVWVNPYDGDTVAVVDSDNTGDLDNYVDTNPLTPSPQGVYVPAGHTLYIESGATVQHDNVDDVVTIQNYGTIKAIGDQTHGKVTFQGGGMGIWNFGSLEINGGSVIGPLTGDNGMPFLMNMAGVPGNDDIGGTLSTVALMTGNPSTRPNTVSYSVNNTDFSHRSNALFNIESTTCSPLLPTPVDCGFDVTMFSNNVLNEVDSGIVNFNAPLLSENVSQSGGEGNSVNLWLTEDMNDEYVIKMSNYEVIDMTEPLPAACAPVGTKLIGLADSSCGSAFMMVIYSSLGLVVDDYDISIWNNHAENNDKFGVQTQVLAAPSNTVEEDIKNQNNENFGLGVTDATWSLKDNNNLVGYSDGADGQVDDTVVDHTTTDHSAAGTDIVEDATTVCDDCIIVQPDGGTTEYEPIIIRFIAFDEVIAPEETGKFMVQATDANGDTLYYDFSVEGENSTIDCGGVSQALDTDAWGTYTAPTLDDEIDNLTCTLIVDVTDSLSDTDPDVTDSVEILVQKTHVTVVQVQNVTAVVSDEKVDKDHNELIFEGWFMWFLLAFIATILTLLFLGDTLGFGGVYDLSFKLIGVYLLWVVMFILIHSFWFDLTWDIGQYMEF